MSAKTKAKETTVEAGVPSTEFLSARKVTVRYIKKESDYIKDPKHAGYGGLFVGSAIAVPAPVMNNKKMKNILTKEEKAGLEFLLGLNLSIYGDFWSTEYQRGSIFPIYLDKDDINLDLSDPMDYIKYKVLLQSEIVANSLDEIRHKATHRFVMIEAGAEVKMEKKKVSSKVEAYKQYVKYEDDRSVLRYVLRSLGRYTDKAQALEFLQVEASKLIDKDPALFASVCTAPYMKTKVLLEECYEYSVIKQIDQKFYTKDDQPISEGNSPTLEVAAEYLGTPVGQEMRLALEAKLKQIKAL